MTAEMNVFCFVYTHHNQLYHQVKTKTLYLKCNTA